MNGHPDGPAVPRRTGAETRREAQLVALELFTRQGYEATSLRQIADRLGINKASLYYHFTGKEAILRSLFADRGDEAEHMLTWLREQPRTPDLLERAVLRWVDSFSADKLRGIRFVGANPVIARSLNAADGDRIGNGLAAVAGVLSGLLPAPSGADLVLLRMALLSINAAVEATADADIPDEDVVAAAHLAAVSLVDRLTPTIGPKTSTTPAEGALRP